MQINYNNDLTPGVYVINEKNIEWGIGQVQSNIGEKTTINFENVGKKTINSKLVKLKIVKL
mgnify:FL=1|tara:strand:+ start:206 stop:388 length:183 start_codon:yes stop_codon:yes gene_type:complete